MNDTVILDVTDGVAVLTLNRPAQKNAIDDAMHRALLEAVPQVRDDAAVHALVLRGAGGAFCSGGDLAGLLGSRQGDGPFRDRMRALHRWFTELAELEKPVIAAVDGPAFGAGFSLALAADFVIASTRASFCSVFGRIGLVPDLGCLYALPRIVGLQRAKEIVFTTRVVEAAEAQALGIVFDTVPAADLDARALALAGRFRHASPAALGMAKSMLNQSFQLDRHAMAELEAQAQALCRDSQPHRDAVQRFLARQPALFSWDR